MKFPGRKMSLRESNRRKPALRDAAQGLYAYTSDPFVQASLARAGVPVKVIKAFNGATRRLRRGQS